MAENEMRKKIEREQKLSEELRVREGIASLEKEEKAKGELAYMRNREDMLEHMRKMERNEQERKKQRELEKEEFNNKYNSLPEPNKQRTFQEVNLLPLSTTATSNSRGNESKGTISPSGVPSSAAGIRRKTGLLNATSREAGFLRTKPKGNKLSDSWPSSTT